MSELVLYDKPVKKEIEMNIWMAFPAPYSYGMASLGYLSVFKFFDLQPNFFVERIFTDTTETKLHVNDVDLIGFSLSFETDFLAFFKIFEKFNIPFNAKDRDEKWPLLFAGGPVATGNPEPFSDFFDFFTLGDGEEVCVEVAEIIKKNKHLSKKDLLIELSKVSGVYVPALTEFNINTNQVTIDGKSFEIKRRVAELDAPLTTPILTEKNFFSNTFIIEVSRGCPFGCKFCMASFLNKPYRCASYEKIIEAIDLGLQHTNKIAFLGALISAHPRFDDICEYVYNKVQNGEDIELSVSSLRANCISEIAIKTLVACGQKHATIAIEAGSERLRKHINKNLTEDELFAFIDVALTNGLKGIKFYSIVGLPDENEDDIKELVELMLKIKNKYKSADFSLTVSTFVPKANTPFQLEKRESSKILEKRINVLKKNLLSKGIQVRPASVNWDDIQALFSRGDRRLGEYAVEVFKNGANLGAFKQVYKKMYKENRLPPFEYFANETKNFQEHQPWDFIKV